MMGGWTIGGMWVWPVLIVAGLLLVGYVTIRLPRGGQLPPPTESDSTGSAARRVLDERYARGEIDADDYMRRRDLLP
jgi:putative membrane protein